MQNPHVKSRYFYYCTADLFSFWHVLAAFSALVLPTSGQQDSLSVLHS